MFKFHFLAFFFSQGTATALCRTLLELEHSFLNISYCFSATLKAENMFILQLLNSYNCLSSKCKSNTAQNSGLNWH